MFISELIKLLIICIYSSYLIFKFYKKKPINDNNKIILNLL